MDEDRFVRLCWQIDDLFNTHLLTEHEQARAMFEIYIKDYEAQKRP